MSIFFYYKVGGWFVILLSGSVILNYLVGLKLGSMEGQRKRKALFLSGLFLNLGLLVWLKYAVFLTGIINSLTGWNLKSFDILAWSVNSLVGSTFNVNDLLVPIGISFYTFQIISYLIEVYRRKIMPVRSLADFGAYITFFPNLISGPIVKATQFVPQIRQNTMISREDFSVAALLIITGLIKKIVIADYISANFVDRVFDNPLLFSGFEHLVAVYGYTLQIYCDFSGYTDIAIGTALLLGFRLPPNFDGPYKARNIAEFWKKWHMSLTSWFLDYLFLPLAYFLSGKLPARKYLRISTEKIIYFTVVMVTFLLCGLWHGAAMNFVIWGGIHGFALALHKFVFSKMAFVRQKKRGFDLLSRVITFHFIVFTWIIFKAKDTDAVVLILRKIFLQFHPELIVNVISGYKNIFLVIVLGYLLVWFPSGWTQPLTRRFLDSPLYFKFISAVLAILFVYQFSASASQPFIYFQF
jgi:D-alanyl-lipoteichoic acid acyltransferase DltB (MBOAT superfamily)